MVDLIRVVDPVELAAVEPVMEELVVQELQEQQTLVVAVVAVEMELKEEQVDQELLLLEDQVQLHLVLVQDQQLQCLLIQVEIK